MTTGHLSISDNSVKEEVFSDESNRYDWLKKKIDQTSAVYKNIKEQLEDQKAGLEISLQKAKDYILSWKPKEQPKEQPYKDPTFNMALQVLLKEKGYYNGKIDGLYGNDGDKVNSQTRAAVKKFQKNILGMTGDAVDGWFGKGTLAAMKEEFSQGQQPKASNDAIKSDDSPENVSNDESTDEQSDAEVESGGDGQQPQQKPQENSDADVSSKDESAGAPETDEDSDDGGSTDQNGSSAAGSSEDVEDLPEVSSSVEIESLHGPFNVNIGGKITIGRINGLPQDFEMSNIILTGEGTKGNITPDGKITYTPQSEQDFGAKEIMVISNDSERPFSQKLSFTVTKKEEEVEEQVASQAGSDRLTNQLDNGGGSSPQEKFESANGEAKSLGEEISKYTYDEIITLDDWNSKKDILKEKIEQYNILFLKSIKKKFDEKSFHDSVGKKIDVNFTQDQQGLKITNYNTLDISNSRMRTKDDKISTFCRGIGLHYDPSTKIMIPTHRYDKMFDQKQTEMLKLKKKKEEKEIQQVIDEEQIRLDEIETGIDWDNLSSNQINTYTSDIEDHMKKIYEKRGELINLNGGDLKYLRLDVNQKGKPCLNIEYTGNGDFTKEDTQNTYLKKLYNTFYKGTYSFDEAKSFFSISDKIISAQIVYSDTPYYKLKYKDLLSHKDEYGKKKDAYNNMSNLFAEDFDASDLDSDTIQQINALNNMRTDIKQLIQESGIEFKEYTSSDLEEYLDQFSALQPGKKRKYINLKNTYLANLDKLTQHIGDKKKQYILELLKIQYIEDGKDPEIIEADG